MSGDPHAERELAVFRDFAVVCPLGIDRGSIEKRDPPEADILCRIADAAFRGPIWSRLRALHQIK